ncbi:acyl-CoA synthetase [Microbacterium sp. C7(2022)]|uniref:acyl-CoA synthetase n=1 Tax=Microbacterium sp. C7(2022) TaxID=2992759 RepID=UPI00237C4040|nr:acyl-CoA synthetase [Microbacterium sp. C7(2022)]MDE0546374.1 acyl-CoA synthetase [Microbacterium sp. C7(2022)]
MTSAARTPTFDVRHVQIARAAFAALAAVMITFSPDHSALIGTTVFSGFAVATGLVFLLSVWLVYPAGVRWPSVLLGITTMVAGMVGSLGPVRTINGFFALVIVWAAITGIIETAAGARTLRQLRRPAGTAPTIGGVEQRVAPSVTDAASRPTARGEARDAIVVGVLTLILAIALLCVPTGFALQYSIEDAPEPFTLTGIIIGVGIFGGYAAIVAVYLGIAGFSPRANEPDAAVVASVSADQKDSA